MKHKGAWLIAALVSVGPAAHAAGGDPAGPASAETAPARARSALDLAAYRPTYVLPLTYVTGLNRAPFGSQGKTFRNQEMQFQLSLRFPVWSHPLGHRNANLVFGYTQRAFWQAYDRADSSPFRETDHEPELMVEVHTDYRWLGFRTRIIRAGLDHQSNGQANPLSRSWNRVFAEVVAQRGDFAFSFRPWYRIPAPAGSDDNPDITHYMGYAQFRVGFRHGRDEYTLMFRDNFNPRDNRGAIRLGWSFPLNERLRGYVQFFNGYGESLIDYNVRVMRIGAGVMLTNWL
ncbi:MAG TPA: phospholipase A [Gammaproteobacteria bacterium]|nr:phospholipase A [Gammaproteobacteria bacterium]